MHGGEKNCEGGKVGHYATLKQVPVRRYGRPAPTRVAFESHSNCRSHVRGGEKKLMVNSTISKKKKVDEVPVSTQLPSPRTEGHPMDGRQLADSPSVGEEKAIAYQEIMKTVR